MTAPHFFAPDVAGERIVLGGEEARHAVRVLRIRPGEEITISDGRGGVVRETVTGASRSLVAEVLERRAEPRPRPGLNVFQAIPKSSKLDVVVQKLTEIGADVIRPFPAERSVARWDAGKATAQTARLSAIAREASKQSRRAWLPEILPPAPLEAVDLPDPTFVLDEESAARFAHLLPGDAPEWVGLVIGPEGGLVPGEIDALARRGAVPVSLGSPILRTETAALVAATVVLVRYGRIG